VYFLNSVVMTLLCGTDCRTSGQHGCGQQHWWYVVIIIKNLL